MSVRYIKRTDDFEKIPGSIFCYWLSESVLNHFEQDIKLSDVGSAKQGLSTSDNNRFLRYWYEVDFHKIGFSISSCEDTEEVDYKWYPYNKAGSYRKWSSINEYVVNYQHNGAEIKATVMKKYPYLNGPGFVVKNTEAYFHHGVTWNDVATGGFCCRLVPNGFIFADAGPMFFSNDDYLVMAYMNSTVFQIFANIICQGLHYSTGHIPQIPFKKLTDEEKRIIKELSKECCLDSEKEWDSFETSWGFKKHPFI